MCVHGVEHGHGFTALCMYVCVLCVMPVPCQVYVHDCQIADGLFHSCLESFIGHICFCSLLC